MNSASTMKISTRLAIGFGSAVALGVLIAGLASWQMRALAGNLDQLANKSMVHVEQLVDFKDNANSVARAVRNIVINSDDAVRQAEKKKISTIRAENARLATELDRVLVGGQAREHLKLIQELRGPYYDDLERVVAHAERGQPAEAAKLLLGDVRARQDAIFKALDDLKNLTHDIAQKAASDANEAAVRNMMVLMALSVVMAGIGSLVAWTTTRSIARALGGEPAEVSAVVQRVADGDLTTAIPVRSGDSTSTMAAVRGMQQSLTRIVHTVRGNSESVAMASAQIAQGNADLSQRTEEQASALEQTAATMDQLSSTVRANAESARRANDLAIGASTVAAKGGEVVGQVVETMKGIDDSSKKIADIIAVIDGIAFQTNILALNAAVEAARAGEQGRGFAVVAAEVRSLAQRSAEAAKQIKTLITGSVEQVEHGTALVDHAGKTMVEIVDAIKRVNEIVGQISVASVEQSAGVSQVGRAISQMDQVTQQNAALVEESAAAAESLTAQAQQLVQTVAVFQLQHSTEGGLGLQRGETTVRARRLDPAAKHDRTAPGYASAGQTAPKRALPGPATASAQPSEQGWVAH